MNTQMEILFAVDIVILGNSALAFDEAFQHAGGGEKVLLASSDTCPAVDTADEHHNARTPDEYRKAAEERCSRLGVEILYFVWPVDVLEGDECGSGCPKLLRVAGKGGLFGIRCRQIHDLRISPEHAVCAAWLEQQEKAMERQERVFPLFTEEETADGERSCVGDGNQYLAQLLCEKRSKLLERWRNCRTEYPGYSLGRFELLFACGSPDSSEHKPASVTDIGEAQDFHAVPKMHNDFRRFQRFPQSEPVKNIHFRRRTCDLVVAGGGTAGAMAAIHAARGGLDVVLLEPCFDLGGTSTLGGVSTYWFGNRFRDVAEIDAAVQELYDTFPAQKQAFPQRRPGIWSEHDDFHAGLKGLVLLKKALEAGVKVCFGELAFGVFTESDGKTTRITGVAAASRQGELEHHTTAYFADAVIDATGDGDLAVFAGADTVYGSERDCITYWGSLAQYNSAGTYQNNFSSMLICADPVDYTRFIRLGRQRGEQLFDHGTYVSMRESRHVRAAVQVTLKDLLTFRTWEDALYTCYSNYDPKGKLDTDMVGAGVLPPQVRIQIPLSALLAVDADGDRIRGLYAAGKAVSATHNVFPSIRMQPDLMHQGSVLGALLAECRRCGTVPEQMDALERRRFLTSYTDDPLTLPDWDPDPQKALCNLTADSRTHWVDVPFLYEETAQSEVLTVMTADPEQIRPLLEKQYAMQRNKAGLGSQLAVLLAGFAIWHGSRDEPLISDFLHMLEAELNGNMQEVAASDQVTERTTAKAASDQVTERTMAKAASDQVTECTTASAAPDQGAKCTAASAAWSQGSGCAVASAKLPQRRASVMCAQLLPDHGVMPELVYMLNLAGMTGSERFIPVFETVLNKLEADPDRDYLTIQKGTWHYAETFVCAAQYSRNPAFIPMLKRLAAFPELQYACQSDQTELMAERFQILLLLIYRALAGLGDREGYTGLVRLLEAPGMPVRCSACMELEALSGRTYGLGTERWNLWIQKQEAFQVQPPATERKW